MNKGELLKQTCSHGVRMWRSASLLWQALPRIWFARVGLLDEKCKDPLLPVLRRSNPFEIPSFGVCVCLKFVLQLFLGCLRGRLNSRGPVELSLAFEGTKTLWGV